MKTEEHLEPIAVFIQRVTTAVSELKDHLQQDYERTYPDLAEIFRIVLDEEEAKAWELSFFPHLFLPDMVEAHIAHLNLQTKHEDGRQDRSHISATDIRDGLLNYQIPSDEALQNASQPHGPSVRPAIVRLPPSIHPILQRRL